MTMTDVNAKIMVFSIALDKAMTQAIINNPLLMGNRDVVVQDFTVYTWSSLYHVSSELTDEYMESFMTVVTNDYIKLVAENNYYNTRGLFYHSVGWNGGVLNVTFEAVCQISSDVK